MKKEYFKLGLLAIVLNFAYAKSQTSPFTNSALEMSNIHENEGRASISVPIEKLGIKDYTLDINAYYDSKGVKVNFESGEIGQNWDLSYKGIITREIYDQADEKKIKVYRTVKYGFFDSGAAYPLCYDYLRKDQVGLLYNLPLVKSNVEKFFNTPNPAPGYTGSISPKFYYNDYSKLTVTDKQSDLFTAVIPGKEPFNFYFDLDGNIKLISNENYKIEYEVDNYSFFKKFILIDEQNVRFTFDSFETVKQDSENIINGNLSVQNYPLKGLTSFNPNFGNLPNCDPNDSAAQYYYDRVPVSWYLSKIENKYGEKIVYNYEPKKILSLQINTHDQEYYSDVYGYSAHINETPVVTSISNETSSLKFNYAEVRKDLLNFDNPNFTNVPRLSSISSFYGNVKKGTVAFDSNYILSNDSNGLALSDSQLAIYRRLFLRSILFLNVAEDKVKDKYDFEYNAPQTLPHRQSFKIYIWGYYRNNPTTGVTAPTTRPRIYYYYDSGLNNVDHNYVSFYKRNTYTGNEIATTSDDKTPVIGDLSIGLINKIKHQGGYTAYQYDSNYFTYYGIKREGPGARVKTVEINDGNTSSFTDYSYGENADGIGYIDSLPVFATIMKGWNGLGGYDRNNITKSANHFAEGTILYKVIRSSKRSSNNANGYIINRYSLFDTVNNSTITIGDFVYNSNKTDSYSLRCMAGNCDHLDATYELDVTSTPFLLPEADMSRVNGKLIKQEIFDNNNNIVESTEYTYQLKWNQLNRISMGGYRHVANSSSLDIGVFGGVQKYYSFNYDPKVIVTKSFFNNGSVQKTKTFTYNNERKVSEIKEQIANNITKTEFKYAYESTTTIGNALRAQNRLNEVAESTLTTDGGGIVKSRTQYNQFTFPTSSATNQNVILGVKQETSLDGNNYYGAEEVTKIGVNGNVIEKKHNGSVYETIIWGYKQSLPIAKIYGASYQQVMQSFNLDPNNVNSYLDLDIVKKSDLDIDGLSEATFVNALETFKNKTELKDFQVTTFTYDPLIGIKNSIQPSGTKELNVYDTNNRLEKVLDKDNNIIKEYNYNLNNTITKYFNEARGQYFYRNSSTCTAPTSVGGQYYYYVPAGKHYSYINQADADQKAQNDINVNGQTVANTSGPCGFVSCDFTPNYYANVNYSSIQQTALNHISMILTYSANPPSGMSYTAGGVSVGYIGAACRPSTIKYINSGNWKVTITPDGYVIVSANSGAPQPTSTVGFSVEYDK